MEIEIVIGSIQPCLDAARALKSCGTRGMIEMWDNNLPYCRFRIDIDKAAALTIEEGDSLPRLRKHRFHPGPGALGGKFTADGTKDAQKLGQRPNANSDSMIEDQGASER